MRAAAQLHTRTRLTPLGRLSTRVTSLAVFLSLLGFTELSASAERITSTPNAEELAPAAQLPPVDTSLARERAMRALERTGSASEFPEEDRARQFTHDGLRVRDRSVRRDIPLKTLRGCAGRSKPKKPASNKKGCGGCNQCGGIPDDPAGQTSSVLQILLALLLLSLIGGLLFRVILNRRRAFEDALSEHELVQEARGLAEDAVEQAAKVGDYNAAIHALFLRTLLRISERGVAIRRDWTPREIPQHIALEDQDRAPLRELVALAELARFSGHRSTAAEFAQAQEAAARLSSDEAGRIA